MNTSTHAVMQEEVVALLDGELPIERKELVSGHLEQCCECATLANQFQSLSRTLSKWNVDPFPETSVRSVIDAASKIHSGTQAPGQGIFIRAFFWSRRKWVLGLSVAAALALLAIISVPNRMYMHRSSESLAIAPYQVGSKAVGQVPEDRRPVNGGPIESLKTLSTPGVATDSNGLFHGLGDHIQSSFSVDGMATTDQQSQAIPGPLIARTVSLTLVVKDFAASRGMLDATLQRHHAYAAELTVNTADGAPRTLQASLRVPAPELAATINELKTLGRVENETQSGEEVTQQHADLVARLRNSRETEQRLQAILLQRTGKISDVLEVEQEIARVRGEIEQMEAEQKSLEHRVDFATVNLSLADVYQAQLTTPFSVGTRLRNGFVDGYHGATETLLGIALFFIESGPSLLIWLVLLGLPVFFVWRRYRRSLGTI